MPHHSTLASSFALLLALSPGVFGCGSPDPDDDGGGGAPSQGYCGTDTESLVTGSGVPENPAEPLSETPAPGSACNAIERSFPLSDPTHVETCTPVAYSTNPPSSGSHYGIWPAYKTYAEPIPRGFWVHAMEHGAVVLAYSCTDCADEAAAADALLAEIGADPLCLAAGDPTRRTLLTPDPRLATRWAAASWGYTLTADCFEPDVFRTFVETHRGNGLEGVCSNGVDVALTPPG